MAAEFDLVGSIMAYEDGQMDEESIVEFFQEIINSGVVWTLQGSYGRTAAALINAGRCTGKQKTMPGFKPAVKPEPPEKTPKGLWTVNQCIAYIESCGWKLWDRAQGVYRFRNENADIAHKDMTFTLRELRHCKNFGW